MFWGFSNYQLSNRSLDKRIIDDFRFSSHKILVVVVLKAANSIDVHTTDNKTAANIKTSEIDQVQRLLKWSISDAMAVQKVEMPTF